MNVLSLLGDAAAVAGSGFAAYGGQLFLRQRSIIFRPSREMTADPGSFGQRFHDLCLSLPDGSKVHGWFLPRSSSKKLVLFFPGAVGNLTHELGTLAFLLSFNVNVLTLDYPGFGWSEGKPSESGCYAAADAAWRYAADEVGAVPEDILLFGRCLGASVAARLAARYECAGLVCHSPWTSVPDIAAWSYPILPARYFCYLRFNTLKFILRSRCPLLLLHADRDRVVPPSHSAKLFRNATSPKKFIPLLGSHYGSDWVASPNLRTAFAAMLNGDGRLWN